MPLAAGLHRFLVAPSKVELAPPGSPRRGFVIDQPSTIRSIAIAADAPVGPV